MQFSFWEGKEVEVLTKKKKLSGFLNYFIQEKDTIGVFFKLLFEISATFPPCASTSE